MMYEVGWIIVPWSVCVILLIAVAKLWHMCGVSNGSNSAAQQDLIDFKYLKHAVEKVFNGESYSMEASSFKRLELLLRKLDGIVADARESEAAHREAVRLLQVAEAELAKYRPNRDKKGLFIPKKKPVKPVDKVKP